MCNYTKKGHMSIYLIIASVCSNLTLEGQFDPKRVDAIF
jgi:hypothetical protein